MKLRSLLVATLVFGSSLAFAQVCPPVQGSVCLVPSSSAMRSQATTYTLPSAMTTTVTTVPYSGTMGTMPMYSASGTCPMMGTTGQMCPMMGMTSASAIPAYSYGTVPAGSMYSMTQPMGMNQMYGTTSMAAAPICPTGMMPAYSYQTMASPMSMAGANQMYLAPTSSQQLSAACSGNLMPDTACIVSQVRNLQGTMVATSLEMRGQDLVTRMNRLMAGEMLFRQQIAANPNLPNAQLIAFQLSQDADALNRDIASFNQQLSMIPVDQRPYLAQSLNAFTVAYWDPTMQRFSMYNSQFASQSPSAYQPAFAANPWLQSWHSGFQTSLNTISTTPQAYASVNWWSTSRVLGSTEMYPGSTMIPAGVVYVPASSISACQPMAMSTMAPTMSSTPMSTMAPTMSTPMATTPTMGTTTTTTTATGTTGVTMPPATETTPMPAEQPGIGY